MPYSILFATFFANQASNSHTKRELTRELEKIVSLKSILVVIWVCLIAGAAIASERERLCVTQAYTELQRLHEYRLVHEGETELLIVTEVDVTN